mmetsp:Transcript_8677/g.22444  ORF Transcript_8677/g.22444 Transcript_8677/m.22444 type:complete len:235 (-) Transcript_8677:405-1109(-)
MRIHQRQSHVTLTCVAGKRLTKAVRSVKAGNGKFSPLKSSGRGTTERSVGTHTASQLPTCGAIGEDFIGPREVLWTVEVWYVSQVFSMRNFQSHSTSYSRRATQIMSRAVPSWPNHSAKCSGRSPSDWLSGGDSSEAQVKTKPWKVSTRTGRRRTSSSLKPETPTMPGAHLSVPSKLYVHAWYGHTWPTFGLLPFTPCKTFAPRWQHTFANACNSPSVPRQTAMGPLHSVSMAR